MELKFSKDDRKQIIGSIQRYYEECMEGSIGNIAADGLLMYFVEEIGPLIYNKAVADVQQNLQQRLSEIDVEVHEEAFTYWPNYHRKRGKR